MAQRQENKISYKKLSQEMFGDYKKRLKVVTVIPASDTSMTQCHNEIIKISILI